MDRPEQRLTRLIESQITCHGIYNAIVHHYKCGCKDQAEQNESSEYLDFEKADVIKDEIFNVEPFRSDSGFFFFRIDRWSFFRASMTDSCAKKHQNCHCHCREEPASAGAHIVPAEEPYDCDHSAG